MSESPQSDPVAVDETTEEKMIVVDPDDYRQTRELRQIHDAKEAYSELKTGDELADRQQYVARVQNLIQELEPLMRQLDTEKDYLDEVPLGGPILVAEPDVRIPYDSDTDDIVDTKAEAIQLAKQQGLARETNLTGLTSLLGPAKYRTLSQKYSGVYIVSTEAEYYPRKICDNAFRFCREFVANAGLGVKIEEDKGPARI